MSSLLSRKFRNEAESKAYNLVYANFISFFLMLGIITILIIKFYLSNVSHFIFYSSVIFSFTVELTLLIFRKRSRLYPYGLKFLLSGRALTIEFILYAGLLLSICLSKINFKGLNDKSGILILVLYLNWFIALIFGHQINTAAIKKNYWNFIWYYIRAYIIVFCLNTATSYLLRLSHYDFLVIAQTTLLYTSISYTVVTTYFYIKNTKLIHENIVRGKKIGAGSTISALPVGITFDGSFQYEYPQPEPFSLSLNNQLREVYLKKFPEVYRFLYDSINLRTIEVSASVIQRTNDLYNLEILPDNSLELFFNLRQINDLRRVNCYLIEVNNKLKYGGIFASKIETINLRYKRFLKSYPYYLARLLYFMDFLWRRVFPKVPGLQKVYFILTRGNNRAISFAEGLGRLYYCGFEIINAKEIDNYVYFVARKVRPPLNDPNPSYGPLFKMKRTGLKGKPIYVYKLRTMHPYAEYLQKFVYEKFSLHEGGKFNNDFRVTSWGKIFRRLWLDELPMIINFFKGDLKLVGVRPLSNHYLNLYTSELRERRVNYKPGLVPPFYVDLPRTLGEIMISEEKYMNSYDKHPLRTDARYLMKAAYNIIIKRVRSN